MSRTTLIRLIGMYCDRMYRDEYGMKTEGLADYWFRGERVFDMDLPTLKATFVRLYA